MNNADYINKEIGLRLANGDNYVLTIENVCGDVIFELQNWSGYDRIRKIQIDDVKQIKNKLLDDFDFWNMPAI